MNIPRLVLAGALLVMACHPGPSQGSEATAPAAIQRAHGIPERRGRVNDYAQLLTSEQEVELAALYESLEQQVGCQMTLLTIESLRGESIEDYSLKVANAWALGRSGIDDGILISVALAEKALRIEVGKGLELLLSDDVTRQIVQHMRPEFAAGRFFKAIEQGSLEIVHRIRGHEELVGRKR